MADAETPNEGAVEESKMSSLDSLFSNDSPKNEPVSHGSSSEEIDEEETDTKDSKPEDTSKKDFPEGDPDASPEKDAKAKPEADQKKDKSEKTPEEKQEKDKEEAQDEKASDQKEPDEEYKTLHKRLRDTQSDWQAEHREKLELQQQLQQAVEQINVLTKIADGTYDPEKDDPQRQITPEIVASKSLQVGKALTSRNLANEQFGADTVNEKLAEFNQLFGKNRMVQDIVLNSDSPVHEAFRILDRYHFESKYGSKPEDWKKSIRAEVEKELKDQLKKEITEQLTEQLSKKKSTSRAFSSSRGSNGVQGGQAPTPKRTPLEKLF